MKCVKNAKFRSLDIRSMQSLCDYNAVVFMERF
ncbi:hypothetical protein J2736_002985 [Paenibacillus qinlingensis]|uniref:Uncharacterized protein n=1 Tax=Paenibacillus qinlingensis TaxID=1837343 RepID=A0ABU1NXK2_9BACL|nr:hypothetical protein [Paenibacillus qinlingensis]